MFFSFSLDFPTWILCTYGPQAIFHRPPQIVADFENTWSAGVNSGTAWRFEVGHKTLGLNVEIALHNHQHLVAFGTERVVGHLAAARTIQQHSIVTFFVAIVYLNVIIRTRSRRFQIEIREFEVEWMRWFGLLQMNAQKWVKSMVRFFDGFNLQSNTRNNCWHRNYLDSLAIWFVLISE